MKRICRVVALGCLIGLAAGLQVAPVRANHGDRTLEVTPETDRNPLGDTHTMTATISAPAETQVLIDWKIIKGPNAVSADPALNVLTAPDFQCQIFPGETTCQWPLEDRRASGGTDHIVAWIDHDGDNAVAEADVNEGPDAGDLNEPRCEPAQCGPSGQAGAGTTAEPDVTDYVLKEWGQLGAARQPYTDGEILFADRACARQTFRADGVITGLMRGCAFTFQVSPEVEVEPGSNHGAFWVQSSIENRNRWCTTRVVTKITLPDTASLMRVAPSDSSARRTRVRETMLMVGDLSTLSSVPTLFQSWLARPGSVDVIQSDDGKTVRLVWTGRSRSDLAFALGVWISFADGTDINEIEANSHVRRRAGRRC